MVGSTAGAAVALAQLVIRDLGQVRVGYQRDPGTSRAAAVRCGRTVVAMQREARELTNAVAATTSDGTDELGRRGCRGAPGGVGRWGAGETRFVGFAVLVALGLLALSIAVYLAGQINATLTDSLGPWLRRCLRQPRELGRSPRAARADRGDRGTGCVW